MRNEINDKHFIRHFSLNVNSAGVEDPYAWQEEVASFCKTRLIPATEALLDELVPGNVFLQLDQLEIELEDLDHANWERGLSERFTRKISDKIKELLRTAVPGTTSGRTYEDAFIHFLTTGHLPWWISAGDFEAKFRLADTSLKRLKETYARNPSIADRLFSQYTETALAALLEIAAEKDFKNIKAVLESLTALCVHAGLDKKQIARTLREILWRKILEGAVPVSSYLDALFEYTIRRLLDRPLRASAKSGVEVPESGLQQPETGASAGNFKILSPTHQIFLLTGSPGGSSFTTFLKQNARLADAIDRSDWVKKWCATQENRIAERIAPSAGAKTSKKSGLRDSQAAPNRSADERPSEVNATSDDTTRQAGLSGIEPNNKRYKTDSNETSSDKNRDTRDTHNVEGGYDDTPTTKTDMQRPTPPAPAQHTDKENTEVALQEGDSLYIGNAGIILLHPFLPALFGALHLLKDRQFTDEAAQAKAVHLLHYLASGEEQAAEYHLPLYKLLCGYELLQPIERYMVLDEQEKEECDQLLKTVLTHWAILKGASPDALREGFLQREGKLMFTEQHYKLIIEQKAIDILLQHLPWGIGTVKHPWMKRMLLVEWM